MYKQTLAKKPRCFLSISSLLLSMLLVAGCDDAGNPFSTSQTTQTITPKVEIINIEQGRLRIPPPPGFCKDNRSSKRSRTSTFLVFANCGYIASQGQNPTSGAQFSGVVTANIAMQPALHDESAINEISGFLSSPEGLKSLSSSGKADDVSIVEKRQTSEGVYVQLRDTNAALSENVWKSFLKRSNHLVTVTLLQNKYPQLTAKQTMQFLQNYSETIETRANAPDPLPPKPHISTEQVKTKETLSTKSVN